RIPAMAKAGAQRRPAQGSGGNRRDDPRPFAGRGGGGRWGMKLYVLRHAEAEPGAGGTSDEARQLTERGKARMAEAARGMRRLGLEFDAILTSPLARARQTAEIVAAEYDNQPPPQTVLELATAVPPARAVAALAPFAHHEQV